MAKEFLSRKEVPFTELNVAENEPALARLRELTGRGSVPTLIIGGQTFIGFNAHRQEIGTAVVRGCRLT